MKFRILAVVCVFASSSAMAQIQVPASSGAERWSRSTLVEEITRIGPPGPVVGGGGGGPDVVKDHT